MMMIYDYNHKDFYDDDDDDYNHKDLYDDDDDDYNHNNDNNDDDLSLEPLSSQKINRGGLQILLCKRII